MSDIKPFAARVPQPLWVELEKKAALQGISANAAVCRAIEYWAIGTPEPPPARGRADILNPFEMEEDEPEPPTPAAVPPSLPRRPGSQPGSPFKPAPPPPQTFDWRAKLGYWAGRDQAGSDERYEYFVEHGIPLNVLSKDPGKMLNWLMYNLPDGPKEKP